MPNLDLSQICIMGTSTHSSWALPREATSASGWALPREPTSASGWAL
ncbi:MAG: hypothetical protein LW724_15435 [Planctomycetaceae bacterium]|nr:hypothetical protein [Planctomycetaceae bacterium]